MLTRLVCPAFGMAISRHVTAKFMPMNELLSYQKKNLTRFLVSLPFCVGLHSQLPQLHAAHGLQAGHLLSFQNENPSEDFHICMLCALLTPDFSCVCYTFFYWFSKCGSMYFIFIKFI